MNFCPDCGARIKAGDKICPNCQKKLGPSIGRVLLFILAGLFVLALLAVLILFVFKKDKAEPLNIVSADESAPSAASSSSTPAGQGLVTAPLQKLPDLDIDFSEEKTRKMSNFMLGGRYVMDDGVLYGPRHKTNQEYPLFCATDFEIKSKKLHIKDTMVYENEVDARYILLKNSWLYYVCLDSRTGNSTLARIKTDGTKKETLYAGNCDYLHSWGDRLYFTDENNHFVSMNFDGTDLQPVIDDRRVFLPYILDGEWLLYQDDDDGESLHLRHLKKGYDQRLAPGRVYEYVISGPFLYYAGVDASTGTQGCLRRIDLSEAQISTDAAGNAVYVFTPEKSTKSMYTRFAVNGRTIIGSNGASAETRNWTDLEDTGYEQLDEACQYVSGSWEVHFRYDKDGYVTEASLLVPDTGKTYILPKYS